MIPSTKKTKRGFFAMCCAVALLIGLLSGCGAEPLSVGEEGADDTKTSAGSAAETARTVVVQETNGTTVVLDAKKASTNAYKGMHLVAGNDVTVQKISDLTMLFDMDKYMYAEESTHFWLRKASGSQEKSKTVIYLDEGATLNRIVNPLENGAVYQVDTPNSTMAVRGTVFRVEVREGKDGKIYTYLAVLNGAVKVELKTTEGKYNGVSETIPAGTAAAIRADETFSEFIGGSGGKHTAPIDYAAFPAGTLRQIIAYIDDNEEINADRDELEALLKQKLSEANGDEKHKHSWQTVTVREADCARTGLQKTVCAVCGETKGQKTLPRAAHKLSGWTVKTKATCESKGLKVKKCGVCGKIIERRQTAALAHQPGKAKITAPTCVKAGSKVISCKLCGHIIKEETLTAKGHQPGDWEITKPATYGKEGERRKVCTVCGEVLETEAIPALISGGSSACSHQVKNWNVTKAPTCTEAGSQSGTCSVCKQSVTASIPATGHNWSDWTITTAATCTADGVETRTCQKCQKSETRAIKATGHKASGEWTVTKEATCTTTGTEANYCAHGCGTVVSTREIPKLPHKLTEQAEKAASCTEAGQHKHWKCTACGTLFADEAGLTETTKETVTIAATGHQLTNHPRVEKTCTTDGTKEYWTCNTCHKVFSDEGGTKETTVEKMKIPKAHVLYAEDWEPDPSASNPATCTTAGTISAKCRVCGDKMTQESSQPLGHKFGEWEVVKPATATEAGEKKRTCTREGCNHTETEPIPSKNNSAEGGQ